MIILDANVVVAGLITRDPRAKTARLVDAVISGRLRPFLSPYLLDEYRAVLLRPKLTALHGLDIDALDSLLSSIVQHARWREPPASHEHAPDIGDDHLWDLLAHEPQAVLITGDLRLLNSPPFQSRVIRVQDFDADQPE